MIGIFWNSEERRLRAFWRLLLQLILAGVLVIPLTLAISLAWVGQMIATGQVTPEQLADPVTAQAVVMGSPGMLIGSTVALGIGVTLSIILVGRFIDRRRFAEFGFHLGPVWWADLGFGLLLGALLMTLIFLAELALGWVTVSGVFATRNPDIPFVLAMLPPLLLFLLVGFYEELFSRGYQLTNLAEGLNLPAISPQAAMIIATILSSSVFGLLHAGNPNATLGSTLNIMLAGVFLATGYVLTGELALSIGLHITWNLFQGNVFGFPVSGGNYSSATVIAVQQGGPSVWTGGAFGPEAGLIGIAAMLIGIALIVLWVRARRGRVALAESITEPLLRSKPVVETEQVGSLTPPDAR